jgi:PKD repeat protein
VSVNDSVSTGALTANRTYNLTCYNSASVSTGTKTVTVSVAAAPTATLTASPTSIAYGGSSTLSWSTTNATSCWADWSGWVSVNDSVSTGALTANRTYNLTCYNSAGVSTGTKTVTVSVAAAPTLSFSSFPTSPATPLAYGAATTLSWSTANTTACWASGDWTGWKTNTGGSESTGALTANKTYYLECWNSAGFSTGIKTILVYVATIPAPASISGSCNSDGAVSVAWTPVTGAVKYLLRIDDQSNPWYTVSTDLLNDNVLTTTYTHTGISGHSYSAWVHACDTLSCGGAVALLSPTVCPLPTLSFTASPTTVDYNASSTLTWSVTNVSSCVGSSSDGSWGGPKPAVSMSESTGPIPASNAYYLECWNNATPAVSTGQKTVTVSLNCSPDTDCVEPTWQCNDFCGKKPYECVSYCGGDCTSVVCSSEINCGPCNSGTWREVTP